MTWPGMNLMHPPSRQNVCIPLKKRNFATWLTLTCKPNQKETKITRKSFQHHTNINLTLATTSTLSKKIAPFGHNCAHNSSFLAGFQKDLYFQWNASRMVMRIPLLWPTCVVHVITWAQCKTKITMTIIHSLFHSHVYWFSL